MHPLPGREQVQQGLISRKCLAASAVSKGCTSQVRQVRIGNPSIHRAGADSPSVGSGHATSQIRGVQIAPRGLLINESTIF